jgi:hypothetical protein
MSDKKQTAVQWLIEEIKNDSLLQAKSTEEWNEIFRKAKQMEREQIVDAYNNGDLRSADLYYKETYGGHSVDANEMIDHIAEVRKMVGGQDER